DKLHIRANQVWYEHLTFQLPSKNYPAFVNWDAWSPIWTDNLSEPYDRLDPPLPATAGYTYWLIPVESRGKCSISQMPSESNNFEMIVLLDDGTPGGQDWYEFKLIWAQVSPDGTTTPSPIPTPSPTHGIQAPVLGPFGEMILDSGPVLGVAYSPDGKIVATCGGPGTFLWDADTGEFLRSFPGHGGTVYSVAFSPDGSKLLTGSNDRTAKLWDMETGALIRTFSGHTWSIYSVAFLPGGRGILTGSGDKTAGLWNTETGHEIFALSGHTGYVYSVASVPNAMEVLTGSRDSTARSWDAEIGQQIKTFQGHSDWVLSVACSPDGTQMITGSYDRTARLWDINGGMYIRSFGEQTDPVNSVAFSPDGTELLTASGNEAHLWNVETGTQIRTFSGHTSWVSSLAFSPDGMKVLTGSGDGTTRIWDIALPSPTPTPTPTEITNITFNESSPGEAGFFSTAAAGMEFANIHFGEVPSGEGTDGQGMTVNARPGEGTLSIQITPISVGPGPKLFSVNVMADAPGASAALAILNSPMGADMGFTQASGPDVPVGEWGRLVLIYDPPNDAVHVGVQVALNETAQSNVNVYYDNLTIRELPELTCEPVILDASGSFDPGSENIFTNVNQDRGNVVLLPALEGGRNVLLAIDENSDAANVGIFASQLQGGFPHILRASVEGNRLSGSGGVVALVMTNGYGNVGTFVGGDRLPAIGNDPMTITIGGGFVTENPSFPIINVVQNGSTGTASAILVDNLEVKRITGGL
ncbi:MAG TPA: WD40 repeat domain-containing protein, partial [bacterium]|nr:WD40 repeat domain-containing protein [bacterium]